MRGHYLSKGPQKKKGGDSVAVGHRMVTGRRVRSIGRDNLTKLVVK